MKLRDIATVKTNFPDADFWLRRSGDTHTVGEVLREFNPDAVGIKIERTDILDPTYARYMFQYLHMKGTWAERSGGTTVQHIRASDVANIQLSPQVTEAKKPQSLDKKKRIQDFISWIYKKENIIDPLPQIKFADQKEAPDQHRTGYYDWHTNTMWVYTGHRNFVDILRTIAHELIHRKQKQQGRIRQKSPPGSKLEREADAEAGMLMKLYVRRHPEIIQEFEKKLARVLEPKKIKKDPDLEALEEMLDEVKIDNVNGAGAVPWNQNVDYLGLRVQMRPSVFLRLALPLDGTENDRERIAYLGQIKDTRGFGAPFLEILVPEDWADGNFRLPAKVVGHDGRHRMRAILDTEGDAPVEVHFIPRRGWRARDFTPEMIRELQSGMTAEWGRYLQGPLFDIPVKENLMIIPTAESVGVPSLEEELPDMGKDTWVSDDWEQQIGVDNGTGYQRAQGNLAGGVNLSIAADSPGPNSQFQPQRGLNISHGPASLSLGDRGAISGSYNVPLNKDSSLNVSAFGQQGRGLQGLGAQYQKGNWSAGVVKPTQGDAQFNVGYSRQFENVLTEYDRNKTAENYGAKLVQVARAKEPYLRDSSNEGILNWALNNLEEADPTPNKKYLQWIARNYLKSQTKMEDVVSTVKDQLTKFDTLLRRKKLPAGYTDINKYSSFGNFFDVMDEFEDAQEELTNKGQARVVYDDAQARVIVPDDEAAACYYGQGTRWCTAATRGMNYFNRYNADGPLYIILPKKPRYPGQKYQVHISSEQFMDEKDDPVDMWELMKEFPGVEQFLLANEPDMQDFIVYASDQTLEPLLLKIREITEEWLWDMVSDYQHNNEWYWQMLNDEGFVDDDGDVDWESAPDYLDYDDELRHYVTMVQDEIRQYPRTIRQMAAASVNDNGTQWRVEELPDLIADEIWNYFHRDDAGAVDFLKGNVIVTRKNDGTYEVSRRSSSLVRENDDDLFEPSQRIKIGKFLRQYAWGMKENPDYWSAFEPEDGEEYEADIDSVLEQAEELAAVANMFLTRTMQAGIEAFRQGDYNNDGWWFDRIADELEEATGIDIGTIADNLNEVSSIHQNVKKKLAKQGYGYIGSGVDQAAFSDPGSQENVFKIFGSRKGNKGWNFTPDQLMFVEWVKYCAAHADNPFLVKTLGYESFQHQQQPYLQIRQERLQPIDNITWGIVDDMVENIAVGYSFRAWQEEWQDDRILSQFAKRIGGVDQLKLLYQTLADVRKYGLSRGYRPDFHRDNIMMRGPGTPVIMDPWNIPMRETTEDYDPNGPPPGPESKPTMPRGTVRVDVSDVYDWYKLGQHISNMKGLGRHDFGQGPPSTIISFGDEDTEHRYIRDLEKTGLKTTDIDPVDPRQPPGMKRQKTDPTYNVDEARRGKKRKKKSVLSKYFFPGYGFFGGDSSGEGGGDGGGGESVRENFADGRVKGRSRPGRVKRAGASCKGSVSDLRARAKKYGGERGRMYHWCANMKSGRNKTESVEARLKEMWQAYKKSK